MFSLVIGVFVGIVLFFIGKKRAAGLAVLAGFVAFLAHWERSYNQTTFGGFACV